MKLSELIDNWEPGLWPDLKVILKQLAGDKDVTIEDTTPDDG